MKKYEEFLKCEYSAEEITDMAKDLARSNQTRASLEQQKKQVDSQLKAQIEVENSTIGRLSSAIATGCEWRNVECRVDLDTPDKGRKTIYRLDTGEEVAIKAMTDEDRQMALDLENQEVEVKLTCPDGEVLFAGTAEEFKAAAESAPLAQAAVMGGTHQRKARKPSDAKREAAADGSEESDEVPF